VGERYHETHEKRKTSLLTFEDLGEISTGIRIP